VSYLQTVPTAAFLRPMSFPRRADVIPSPRLPAYNELHMVPSELPTSMSGPPSHADLHPFSKRAPMHPNMQRSMTPPRSMSPPVFNPMMVPSPRQPMAYSELPMVPSELSVAPQLASQSAYGSGWHASATGMMQLPDSNPFSSQQHMTPHQRAPIMHDISSNVESHSDASSHGSSSSNESSEPSLGKTPRPNFVEKLVYADRPVYMDRIVQVPVFVDEKSTWPVTIRTVRSQWKEPSHDFPYHNPLPEEGCDFIDNHLSVGTEIFAY